MLWVGGGIIVHALHTYHVPIVPDLVDSFSHWAGTVPGVGAVTGWMAMALGSAAVGAVIGGVIVTVVHVATHRKH